MKKQNNIDKIKEAILCSGFSIINFNRTNEGFYKIEIDKINHYTIYAFIRTVSGSGWSNKPDIRRVQIKGFDIDSVIASGHSNTSMIIGVDSLYSKDIFIFWNIYNFGNHKKNRSCYVHVNNIFQTFNKGYTITTDFKQKIWLSDKFNFNIILKDYMKFNESALGA